MHPPLSPSFSLSLFCLPEGPPSYLPDKLPSRTNAPALVLAPRSSPRRHIWEEVEEEGEEGEAEARLNEAFTVVHLRATQRPILPPPPASVCKSCTSDNFMNSPLRSPSREGPFGLRIK